MLVEEFLRAGVDVDFKRRRFIDVQNIFHKMEQRTLVAAYKFYCDKNLEGGPLGRGRHAGDLRGAEGAAGPLSSCGTTSRRWRNSPRATRRRTTPAAYSSTKGEEVFGFGKYKGRKVEEIFDSEPSYYAWMMNGDFPLYTKKVISRIRCRRKTANNTQMKRVLLLIALTIAAACLHAAVPVERSQTVVYISGEKFYIHTVQGRHALRHRPLLQYQREHPA